MGGAISILDSTESSVKGQLQCHEKSTCEDESSLNIDPRRGNLYFPNEILEKILSFLSLRDKLIAREVCSDWMHHINVASNMQDLVKIKISSDELNYLSKGCPVYTSFYFYKVDLTRQSMGFWSLYSERITYLEFYDSSIIPRNTVDSTSKDFILGCPNLKHLGLINCDKYFLMGGKFIQLHEILCLEKLKSLNLSRNKNLTDSILFSILLKTNALESLDLSDCVNMVFMRAVHNRFYPAGTVRPPYSDNVLSFHTLCKDFLQTERAMSMKRFNFGMKLNSTGMDLLLSSGSSEKIKWECANLESPELKVADIKQFFAKYQSSLTSIELGRCKLTTDEILSSNLYSLVDFSLHDSRSITSLYFLTSMPNLRRLVIDGTIGFNLDSQIFSTLSKLTDLSLNGIQANQQDPEICGRELIKSFQLLPNLTSLDVGNCTSIINDAVVQGIIVNLRKLKRLNLEATCVSDRGLAGIKAEAVKSGYSSKSVILLQQSESNDYSGLSLSLLENLEDLNLSRCRELGDSTWRIALRLPNLISLNLSNCNTLSKRGLLSIIDNCRNIENLNLVHCSRQIITDSEVLNSAREKLYRCKGITY